MRYTGKNSPPKRRKAPQKASVRQRLGACKDFADNDVPDDNHWICLSGLYRLFHCKHSEHGSAEGDNVRGVSEYAVAV